MTMADWGSIYAFFFSFGFHRFLESFFSFSLPSLTQHFVFSWISLLSLCRAMIPGLLPTSFTTLLHLWGDSFQSRFASEGRHILGYPA